MIIGIDASRASTKQRTGTEKYSRDLIFAISEIDSVNDYILYVGPNYDGCFDNLPKNFSLKLINYKKYWTQIGLSLEMIKSAPEVLFIPSHLLPAYCPKNSVVTIHDLAWKYFPETYSSKEIRLHELGIKRAIKKKAKIIVYSESTLNDLKKYYKIDSDLINFVPMGFEIFKASGEISDDIKTLSENDYLLFVGRIESKKNIVNLVKSYEMLRAERKIKHKLVLVGKPGFGYNEIKKQIDNSKYKRDIHLTGFVSDRELESLYKNASLFVFPSLYEGFGYPILEAFSASVPVVTSKTSSMPEVAGRGAILVNPKKPFEITVAMSQILNKSDLKNKMIRDGHNQVKKFTWETCAQETLKVLTRTDDK